MRRYLEVHTVVREWSGGGKRGFPATGGEDVSNIGRTDGAGGRG